VDKIDKIPISAALVAVVGQPVSLIVPLDILPGVDTDKPNNLGIVLKDPTGKEIPAKLSFKHGETEIRCIMLHDF